MYKLFLDMDGVIVDFERGVKKLTGTSIREFAGNLGRMWKAVAGVGNFYTKLDWMPDGEELWTLLAPLNPTMLTGIPHGHGWGGQKHIWVNEHLDPIPRVIIKPPSRTKMQAALEAEEIEAIPDGETWILIDDTAKMGSQWGNEGGVFIHHKNAETTIQKLLEIPEVREDLEIILTN